MTAQGEDERYRINPEKLPKRIDLELTPETERRLTELATASGRSIDELILELLDQALQDEAAP